MLSETNPVHSYRKDASETHPRGKWDGFHLQVVIGCIHPSPMRLFQRRTETNRKWVV